MNFDYNEVEIPEDGIFKISPSGIEKFFSYPVVWYKEHITKEEKFEGSTATVLGSVIHALAEAYALNLPTSRAECDTFIESKADEIEDLDVEKIKELYPDMAGMLINEYISQNPPTEVEQEVCALVKDGVYVAGTCDNRTGSIVTDYKNVSQKPNTDKIPFGYLIQMLAYAYAYRAKGIHIDQVRLVYTVRPTKTLGIRIFVVNHIISSEDWKMIEDTLELIADTVLLHLAHPELDYITFKSMNIKG